jgi:multidrug/hemolysin transport system permease protein
MSELTEMSRGARLNLWHHQLAALMRRNMRLYFHNKMTVFISLLGALMALLIIIVFMRSSILDEIVGYMQGFGTRAQAAHLLDLWTAAGAATIATMTTALAALQIYVKDREIGAWRDLLVSPLPRWVLTLSYLLSAFLISILMTTITFAVGLGYAASQGASLDWNAIATSWGYLALCSVSFTALMGAIIAFVKNQSVHTALSVVIGVGFGFFNGVYINFGAMGKSVTDFFSALPFAQSSMLTRAPMVESVSINWPTGVKDAMWHNLGVTLSVNGHQISVALVVGILCAIAVVGFFVAYKVMMRRQR